MTIKQAEDIGWAIIKTAGSPDRVRDIFREMNGLNLGCAWTLDTEVEPSRLCRFCYGGVLDDSSDCTDCDGFGTVWNPDALNIVMSFKD